MEERPQIIGGLFGVGDDSGCSAVSPPFLNERSLLLTSARSGIRLLLEAFSPPQVWIPSFLCGAITDAVISSRVPMRFYEVDNDLSIADRTWLEQVLPGDIVLFIDYFGFSPHGQLMQAAKDKGAMVLEDACHALLSPKNPSADGVLYSPRKFMGVPDGGILNLKTINADLFSVQPMPPDSSWVQTSLKAGELRAEFDRNGGDNGWFALFQQAESMCPVEPFAMSRITQDLLPSFDYGEITRTRRENYMTLANRLGEIALFPELPADVVPLGFPVAMEDRDHVRAHLFDQYIYPPVHWPLAGIVPPEFKASHQLASEIMTLPCDQRYTVEDMDRIINALLSA